MSPRPALDGVITVEELELTAQHLAVACSWRAA